MQHLEFGPAWPGTDEKSEAPLIVSLHGFPALRSQQNRVIAGNVAQNLGRRVEAPLYSGLGVAPGIFSFKRCLEEVRAFVRERLAAKPGEGRVLDLLGHSWGGYMSLALANDPLIGPRLRRITLMSPLLRFGTSAQVRDDLLAMASQTAAVNLGDLDELAKEFESLGRERPSAVYVAGVPREIDVFVLQASDDQVTPPEVATTMVKNFARPPRFEVEENDHGFTRDRVATASRIAEFFR